MPSHQGDSLLQGLNTDWAVSAAASPAPLRSSTPSSSAPQTAKLLLEMGTYPVLESLISQFLLP